MLGYERLFQKPALFTRTTGIKFGKFELLVSRAMILWNTAEQKRLNNKARKRAIGGGRKYRLETMELKIFFMLMFYRHNITHELLGLWFNLDASNVTRLIGKLSLIFEEAADPSLKAYLARIKNCSKKISTDIEFYEQFPEFRLVCTDATEQRKQRSQDKEKRKSDYSGKKKAFTRKTQISISATSRIIDISNTYPGSVHDKKVFDLEQTIKKMPAQSEYLKDLGYLGSPQNNPKHKIILPHKRKKGQKELPPAQKKFNKKHAQKRIIVEHTIGRIKRFRVCSDVYRGSENGYNQMFRNVAALVNLNTCVI